MVGLRTNKRSSPKILDAEREAVKLLGVREKDYFLKPSQGYL